MLSETIATTFFFNNCANASILSPLSEVFKTSYIGSYLASTSNWPTYAHYQKQVDILIFKNQVLQVCILPCIIIIYSLMIQY